MNSKIAERSSARVVHPPFGAWWSEQLLGQRGEERLGDGVVEARADGAHRLGDAGVVAGLAEQQPDELPGLNRSSQQCLLGDGTSRG